MHPLRHGRDPADLLVERLRLGLRLKPSSRWRVSTQSWYWRRAALRRPRRSCRWITALCTDSRAGSKGQEWEPGLEGGLERACAALMDEELGQHLDNLLAEALSLGEEGLRQRIWASPTAPATRSELGGLRPIPFRRRLTPKGVMDSSKERQFNSPPG